MKTIKEIVLGLMIVFAVGIVACGGGGSSGGGGNSDWASNNIPTNVTAEAGNQQVTIRWDNVSGANYYNIYWGPDNSVSKKTGTRIYDAPNPYVDLNLSNGIEYFYVVTAVTADGESDESKVVSAMPSLNPPPPPPGP